MQRSHQVAALLLAAGTGQRASARAGGASMPKQYRPLAGRPLLVHALEGLRHPRIDQLRVVIAADQEAEYRAAVEGLDLPPPIAGGATRQQSVRNGLEALAGGQAPEMLLVHDCARPFTPAGVVERLLDALATSDAAVPVLPVVDTLAQQDEELGEAVPRETLVRVQTPQAFRFDTLLEAHRAWRGEAASDDAQVVRAAGVSVATVAGDERLEKITYEADFRRAEAHIVPASTSRTGFGFDVHAFGQGDAVWLGGIPIPYDRGLVGHSDADVLLHALADALLGTIAGGDIGDHFASSDPRWRGMASSHFVEAVRDMVMQAGGRILHVDATLICQEPRVAPHREAMRGRIAALLQVPVGSVSIKATTTDGLGFTGRREGIAAQAVATVLVNQPPVHSSSVTP
ncbi:MAG: bifunctional 2-C-methyl-D-erythritol 4-phosphate cytidylyltransferase/2-C-methyl-D-erythritol 2,4-cyclodiphosphate synthase [Sphingosinicella sp.]